jgi:hypothetical protein
MATRTLTGIGIALIAIILIVVLARYTNALDWSAVPVLQRSHGLSLILR